MTIAGEGYNGMRPEILDRYVSDGWTFAYEPGTFFVGVSHPRGGKQTVCEIRGPVCAMAEREEVGHYIASALQNVNALPKLVEAGWRYMAAVVDYRRLHDLHGDGSTEAGRAWDRMRKVEDDFERALSAKAQGGELYAKNAYCSDAKAQVGGEERGIVPEDADRVYLALGNQGTDGLCQIRFWTTDRERAEGFSKSSGIPVSEYVLASAPQAGETVAGDMEKALVSALEEVFADCGSDVPYSVIAERVAAVVEDKLASAPASSQPQTEWPKREEGVDEILSNYTKFINARPALLSLLYDIDMMPEQTVTRVGAARLAGLCEVWRQGEAHNLPVPPISKGSAT